MQVGEIIETCSSRGIHFEVIGEKLLAYGSKNLTDELRFQIRSNKWKIIKALLPYEKKTPTDDDRQNIDACQKTRSNIRVFHYRLTDNPNSRLVMIAPNCDVNQASDALSKKFGDRFIEVKPYRQNTP